MLDLDKRDVNKIVQTNHIALYNSIHGLSTPYNLAQVLCHLKTKMELTLTRIFKRFIPLRLQGHMWFWRKKHVSVNVSNANW